ncbi:CLUMA_CG011148, isoform A [Clunio marinus]|uniref:CLUMA_CG011148, isoform A n=1 Tax=Clunio marinus TaxID=568069 RepID=A0A1J1IC08_9DIPT|nr:CLUMA_CG011148, isoform A [Clunio marinus]
MAYNLAWQITSPGIMGNLTVVDKVPQEMMSLIDPHWYQFPPMNPLWHSILGFAIGLFLIIALLGNMCVIYIFTKTKTLRTPSNLFVVNLAVSDFMIMFTMGPPMVVNCYHETWVFGPLMCQLYGMAGSLFGCVSIWTMTMIAFDRYNVIVKGLSAKPLSHGSAVFKIFVVWVASAVWTVLPLFGWNRYVPEGNMTACGTDYLSKGWESRSYVLVYGIWVYFLPLLMIIYSYYFILKAVGKHEKNMREQAKKMNVASLRSAENSSQSTECKLAKIALMTISLWFMAWTPYLIINFAGIFDLTALSPLATIWGSLFAKANAIYNPIVYGISHPKYRAALLKTFPSLACGSDNDNDTQSVASGVTTVAEEKAEKPTA